MKKGDLRDLIIAHYEGDNNKFFNVTLKLLKELKDAGDVELEKDIEFYVLANVRVRPKQEPIHYDPEISFEEGEYFGLVPQENNND